MRAPANRTEANGFDPGNRRAGSGRVPERPASADHLTRTAKVSQSVPNRGQLGQLRFITSSFFVNLMPASLLLAATALSEGPPKSAAVTVDSFKSGVTIKPQAGCPGNGSVHYQATAPGRNSATDHAQSIVTWPITNVELVGT